MRVGTKRRPRRRNNQDPSLAKIIFGILVVGGAVMGVMRFSDWFSTEYVAGEVENPAEEGLERVEAFLGEGDTVQAREVLRPILARVDDPALTPAALLLQAELDQRAGDTDAALEHLRQAAQDYPNSPHWPEAAVKYARMLESQGAIEQAFFIFEQVRDKAPPEWAAAALSAFGRQKEREGDTIGARELYGQAIHMAAWDSDPWKEAAENLGRVNVELIFSSGRTPESKVYKVQRGDSLTTIGIELNTTQGLLMRANNIDNPNKLYPGQHLKYTPKDFHVVLERSTCRLFLFDSDGLFKVYKVGLGKPNHETTLGQYKIGNKEKDPTWFKPGSEPIPPGDPRNELGTRWMPLVPEAEGLPTDLGIHGTIRPESIGKYESLGCPRLHKEDVEELYDLIVRATPVSIVEKYVPNDSSG